MTDMITCPNCKTTLKPGVMPPPGKKIICPKCNGVFRYHPNAAGAPPSESLGSSTAPASTTAAPVPQPILIRSGVNPWLLAGFMLLLGMLIAGGVMFLVMGGKKDEQAKAPDSGEKEPAKKGTVPEDKKPQLPSEPKDPGSPSKPPMDTPPARPENPSEPKSPPEVGEGPKPPDTVDWGREVDVTILDTDAPVQADPRSAPTGGLIGPKAAVDHILYTPDGSKLVAVYHNGKVHLWDLAARTQVELVPDGPGVAVLSPDGKTVVTGSSQQVAVYDAASGVGKAALPGRLMAASANAQTAVSQTPGYKFHILDLVNGKEVMPLDPVGKTSGGYHIAVSPDGKTVAFETMKDVRLFDVAGVREMPRLIASTSGDVEFIQFVDNANLLVVAGRSIAVWDVSNRNGQAQLRQRAEFDQREVSLSPDGKTAAVSRSGRIELWDAATLKPRVAFPGNGKTTFSVDGRTAVAHAPTTGVTVAFAATGQVRKVIPDAPGASSRWAGLAIAPDGKTVAIGNDQGGIHFHALEGGGGAQQGAGPAEIASLPLPPGTRGVESEPIVFSPDGRFAVVPSGGSQQGMVGWHHLAVNVADRRLSSPITGYTGAGWGFVDPKTIITEDSPAELFFDLATGKMRERKKAKNAVMVLPRHMLLAPDAKKMAVYIPFDTKVKDRIAIMNPANGQIIATLAEASATRMDFTPDSKFLVTSESSHKVKLFDVTSSSPVPTTAEHARDYLGFADNGKWIVTRDGNGIHLYEVGPNQMHKELNALEGHTGRLNSFACSPAGPICASVGANGEVLVRDLIGGAVRARLSGHNGDVKAVGFSPDGKTLVTAGDDKVVKIWDVSNLPAAGAEIANPAMPNAPAKPQAGRVLPFKIREYANFPHAISGSRGYIKFSKDGNIVSAGYDTTSAWDLTSKTQKVPVDGKQVVHWNYSNSRPLSPDGRFMLHAGGDWLHVLDLSTGQMHKVVQGDHNGRAEFSPDSKSIAIGLFAKGVEGKTLVLFDLNTFTEKAALTGFDANGRGIGFTPDGSELFAVIEDRLGYHLYRLDPQNLKQRSEFAKVGDSGLWFSPDSKLIGYVASPNTSTIKLAEIATGNVRSTLAIHGTPLVFVAGQPLLVSGNYSDLTLWDMNTGQPRLKSQNMMDQINKAVGKANANSSYDFPISHDGRWFANGADDGSVLLWDTLRMKLVAKFKAHAGGVEGLGFSPDGRFLATIGEEKKLKIWYLDRDGAGSEVVTRPRPENPPPMPTPPVKSNDPVNSNPDKPTPPPMPPKDDNKPNTPLVPSNPNPGVPGLPVGPAPFSNRQIAPNVVAVGSFDSPVHSIAYSPDGKNLAAMGSDQIIKLFNFETKIILTFGSPGGLGRPQFTNGLCFTPDGQFLVSVSGDSATVWDLAGKEMRKLAHADWLTCVAMAKKSGLLATAAGSKVTLWEVAGWTKKFEMDAGKDISCVAFSNDGQSLVGAAAGVMFVWETSNGRKKFERPFKASGRDVTNPVVSITFTPDDRLFAAAILNPQPSARLDQPVVLFDLRTATNLNHPFINTFSWTNPGGLAFTSDGTLVVAHEQNQENRITFWDLKDRREKQRKELPPGVMHALTFSPDGRTVAFGGENRDIHLWRLDGTPKPSALTFAQGSEVHAVSFSKSGRVLIAAGKDAKNQGEIRLWNMQSPDKKESMNLIQAAGTDIKGFSDARFAHDGKMLAAAGGLGGRSVHFFDSATGKPAQTWTCPPNDDFRPVRLALAPDGKMWATAGAFRSGDISAVYLVEKEKEKTPAKFSRRASLMTFSADATLLYGFDGGVITPYSTATGEPQPSIEDKACAMAGLSDGTKLVAAMNSVLSGNGQGVPAPVPARHHVVRIFDTATGKMAKQLAAPWVAETQNLGMDRYRVNGAVGMTEQLVALAAIEVQGPRQLLSLTVWDIASGRVKKAVLTDADPAVVLTSLSIAPDGRFVAIGGQHADRPGSSTTVGKIWLWRLDD